MEMKALEWIRGAIIGSGSFGTVSLAINKSNGELFAVKSAAEDSVSCLENEFNILRSLNSPHIVKCLGKEHSNENGVEMCNLLMEYVPGGSVGDLLAKFGGRLDESLIKSLTRGILCGLDYLHRQGIVHCDVKGRNVLVGGDGLVKLGDFGSARRREEKGVISGGLRGTPLWMAPEVLNQVEQGPPSDIWSLGCTVVEMATGRSPWVTGSNPLSALYLIGCTDQLPELPTCLSPQGRDFLEKCFRRDPKQRWTAAQLLEHPFLSQIDFCSSLTEVKRAPLSPTAILDFGRPDWGSLSSSLCQSAPILSLAIERCCMKGEEMDAVEKLSAKERLAALAVGCDKPDWSSSDQWIVVRSTPPFSNAQNCPAEAESKSNMEISDEQFTHIQVCSEAREEISSRDEEFTHTVSDIEGCSEAREDISGIEVCSEAREEISSTSIMTSLIVDECQELSQFSINHAPLHNHPPQFHSREEEREITCDSDPHTAQICFTYCILPVDQICPQICMEGEMYIINSRAETQNSISIHLNLFHIFLVVWDDLCYNGHCVFDNIVSFINFSVFSILCRSKLTMALLSLYTGF